jgi:ubiquinone/menaquinone biosynthesis C-methylase UbiE
VSAATETFWDKRSEKYDDRIRQHDSLYEKTLDRARSLLTDSDVVLDFACATGEWSLDLAASVARVHGIDSSARMIELAQRKAEDRQVQNVVFDRMDALDPRLAPESFSAIVGFNIFHLLDDPPAVLARLHDLLKPEGLLISKTPCLGEWNLFLRSLIVLAQRVGFVPTVRSFKFPELQSLVSRRFEILEVETWDAKSRTQWVVARKKGRAP